MLLMLLVAGCGQGKTAQEEYDAATAAYAIELQLADDLDSHLDADNELLGKLQAWEREGKERGETDTDAYKKTVTGIAKTLERIRGMENRIPHQRKQLDAAKKRRNLAWESLR